MIHDPHCTKSFLKAERVVLRAAKGKAEHAAVIWGRGSESAYDIGILERPELHASVLAATEQQRRGPVSHSLRECLEVLGPPP